MKHSLMYISLHLIHIKYVKRKPPRTMIGKKKNTKENQVFSLILIEHIFSKKLQSEKLNEKGAYGLGPG